MSSQITSKDENQKLLAEIEQSIRDAKEEYHSEMKKACMTFQTEEIQQAYTIRKLLLARKNLLNDMFVFTQESFDALKQINDVLLHLTNTMNDKLRRLYQEWLDSEEPGWQEDCQVIGKIMTDMNNCDDVPDETGSAYVEMNDLICEIDDLCFYKIEFSGYKDNPLDFEQLGIDHEEPFESFIDEHPNAFGDFYMCQAFENLMNGCFFSKQDILRILNFWCDAEVVHQCGVNVKGNYIKTVEYER